MNHPALALAAAQLRAMLRDRTNLVMALVFAALSGAAPPLFGTTVLTEVMAQLAASEPESEKEDEETATTSLGVAGEAPAWLDLDKVGRASKDPGVLVRISAGEPVAIEVVTLSASKAATRAVEGAINDQLRAERSQRLTRAGVTERPGRVARTRFVDAEHYLPSRPALQPSALGVVLLFLGAFLMNPVLDALPRARTSGWLESLAVTRARSRDVILGTWMAAWVTGMVLAALALLGFAAAGLYQPMGLDTPLSLVPVLTATLAAYTIWLMASAVDVRAAYLRSFWWVPVVAAATAGAASLGGPWGGLVPLGGVVGVVIGVVPSSPAALGAAWTGGLLTTAGLLAWSARTLARSDLSETSGSRSAKRRAGGDWRPEVLLLFLVAVAGVTCWQAILPTRTLVAGALVGLLAFVLAPALAAGPALGLPARPLLGLRRPSLMGWLLIPALVAGTQGAGLLGHLLQQALFPNKAAALAGYGELMGELSVGLGLAVVTVAPGICEELLFRGVILNLLLKRGRVLGALLGQAALFAMLHIYGFKLLPTFGVGLMLGIYAWRCRSIWPVMVAHILHNLVAVRLGGWMDPDWLASPAGVATLTAMTAAGLGACRLVSPRRPRSP